MRPTEKEYFVCAYCTDDFDDRVPLEKNGKKFCTRQCRERYFMPKQEQAFQSISSL